MNLRRLLIATLVLLLLSPFAASLASAQEVTLTSVVKGAYLGPDGAVWYSRPLLQSDVFVAWDNGIYADLWTSTGFNSKKDWDKEVDLTIGYGGKFRRVSYSLEGVYFAVLDGDILHAKGEVVLDGSRISPFVAVSGFWPTSKGGPKSGSLLTGGLRSKLPLGKRVELGLEASARHDSGAFGYDRAWLAFGSAKLDITLGERTSLLLGVVLSRPVTSVTDGRKGEMVWEIGFSHRLK